MINLKIIKVTALTEKGKEIMSVQDKPGAMEKATNMMFGIKEKVVSESPYTVEVTIKRNMPKMVFEQIPTALQTKFFQLGATVDDFKIEVL